jgi:hypothetical protein
MPRDFHSATAEQVIAAVESVVVNQKPTRADFTAAFADIPLDQAESALGLAVDLGFLSTSTNIYKALSPLCRLVSASENQRAAILRIVLESYHPFTFFRERLALAVSVTEAARQTKVALDLDARYDAIKDTLVSLGTYSQALSVQGGGRYSSTNVAVENQLEAIATACADIVAAEARIIQHIGHFPADRLSRDDVVHPLADALLHAAGNDSRGAVVRAGNAVESHLLALGTRKGINLEGANGINAKIERFTQAGAMPTKLANAGKYLGHVRNGADHGVDPEVNSPWTITRETGYQYVFVASTFVSVTLKAENGEPPML